ncbi:MAG: hypothetical protein WBP61_12700 [Nocardioides sp.]
MTTETAARPRVPGTRALVRAALATVVLGLAATLVAALTSGSAAAWGAAIGTAIVVGVFAFGSFTVNLVASVMPAAALIVALLTYTLQVVAMALVFVALSRSEALDASVDPAWLAGTVIAGTIVWLTVQVVVATTTRIPVYDLPEAGLVSSGTGTPEAGER